MKTFCKVLEYCKQDNINNFESSIRMISVNIRVTYGPSMSRAVRRQLHTKIELTRIWYQTGQHVHTRSSPSIIKRRIIKRGVAHSFLKNETKEMKKIQVDVKRANYDVITVQRRS